MLIVGRIINGLAVGVSSRYFKAALSILITYRSAQHKFRFTLPSLRSQASVVDSSVLSNGLLPGAL